MDLISHWTHHPKFFPTRDTIAQLQHGMVRLVACSLAEYIAEPASYAEAAGHPSWQAAMYKEIQPYLRTTLGRLCLSPW